MTHEATAFCRDCLAPSPRAKRCPTCGSPRLIAHPELARLAIAHIDCDAFYASIEKRDDPSLRDQPVIVGGGRRGVVATACYQARAYGVRSAMPMFKALAACPKAVVVRPNMAKYAEVGRVIRAMMSELTPLVEPLSIDEAFLDLSGTELIHRACPAATLAGLARRVETELGLTVSIGLSYCKFLAKIASDLDKPRGFAAIGRTEAVEFLANQPVGLIWGVGAVAQKRLAADGFGRIGDLHRADAADLVRRYGEEGLRLWRLARGQDERPVDPSRVVKSVSAETTFESDVADPKDLARALYLLCEKVSSRLTAKELGGRAITLKLKTDDFRLLARARRLSEPTRLAARIFDAARELLILEAKGTRFRLIGVGVSELSPANEADMGDLADPSSPILKARQDAVDALRAKFGAAAVVRGIVFEKQAKK
jgi:DNA polymerase IV